jgi:hypothetical protein
LVFNGIARGARGACFYAFTLLFTLIHFYTFTLLHFYEFYTFILLLHYFPTFPSGFVESSVNSGNYQKLRSLEFYLVPFWVVFPRNVRVEFRAVAYVSPIWEYFTLVRPSQIW